MSLFSALSLQEVRSFEMVFLQPTKASLKNMQSFSCDKFTWRAKLKLSLVFFFFFFFVVFFLSFFFYYLYWFGVELDENQRFSGKFAELTAAADVYYFGEREKWCGIYSKVLTLQILYRQANNAEGKSTWRLRMLSINFWPSV